MIDVVIYGAGGLGRVVHDILHQAGEHRPVAYIDSDADKHGRIIDGLRVRGGLETVEALLHGGVSGAIVAVGDNLQRACLADALLRRGMKLVSAIHPLASISPSASVAAHVIIGARVNICVHSVVGPHSVLSAGCIIEHDNRLGTGVFLSPAVRLAGAVTVDDYATLGIGACVIPGRRIGRGARVDPGAVVIRDVPDEGVVGGVPAREIPAERSRFVADALPAVPMQPEHAASSPSPQPAATA